MEPDRDQKIAAAKEGPESMDVDADAAAEPPAEVQSTIATSPVSHRPRQNVLHRALMSKIRLGEVEQILTDRIAVS